MKKLFVWLTVTMLLVYIGRNMYNQSGGFQSPPTQKEAQPDRVSINVRKSVRNVDPLPDVETNSVEVVTDVEPDEVGDDWVMMLSDAASVDRLRAAAAEAGFAFEVIDSLLAVRVRAPSSRAMKSLLASSGVDARILMNRKVALSPTPPEPPEGVKYTAFGPYLLNWLGILERNENWGEGVVVAVLDTPMDVSNSALNKSSIEQVEFDGSSGEHGLAVASIIAGAGGDVNGIAPGVDLLSFPVLSGDGSGSSFDLAEAIVSAVDAGAHIINLSLGCRESCPVLDSAVGYAADAGVVIVAAAGNDGTAELLWPARDPRTLAIAANDSGGENLWFSNRGDSVDLSAPGLAILAATDGDDPVKPFSGTSAAAAVVSGVLAGILSMDENLSSAEVAELLCSLADEAGEPGADPQYGKGLISPVRVLEWRDSQEIVDLSMAKAWVAEVEAVGDDALLMLTVQNRGTQPVSSARLRVSFAGSVQDWSINDIQPGAIESREVRISNDYLNDSENPLHVIYGVELIDGAGDSRPKNNVRQLLISLP